MTKKYLPYTLVVGLAVALALAGLGGITSAEEVAVQAGALPDNQDGPAVVTSGQPGPPARRETTVSFQNPADPTALVLSGEMGNGGYWTWEEITNLLGVYSQYGAFAQVTLNGRPHSGVPLSYLLDYARLNSYATTLLLETRHGEQYLFAVEDLLHCQDCLVTLMPDHTLTLILPGRMPEAVPQVMRLDAYAGEPAILSTLEMPDDPQTILLTGCFSRDGLWTWQDLANLLGVYRDYGAFETVYVDDQAYVGVPLAYLLNYARLDENATALVIYDRAEGRASSAASTLRDCAACLIAPAPDNTLTLVMPGLEPSLIEQIAAIEAR